MTSIVSLSALFADAAASAAAAAAPAAEGAQAAPQGGGAGSMLFFVLLLVGMWFLLIAPQRRRQKEQQKMLAALGPGDKVITAGGIIGTIRHVDQDNYTLQIDDGVQIKILKPYIQAKRQNPSPEQAKK